MSAGGIIPRKGAGPKPQIKLPITMRGTEPIFDYLIATAEKSFELQDQQLEELRAIRRALEKALWISDHPDGEPFPETR